MTINPKAKIPPVEVLYAARLGIEKEINEKRSPKARRKLYKIFEEMTFIIQSVLK